MSYSNTEALYKAKSLFLLKEEQDKNFKKSMENLAELFRLYHCLVCNDSFNKCSFNYAVFKDKYDIYNVSGTLQGSKGNTKIIADAYRHLVVYISNNLSFVDAENLRFTIKPTVNNKNGSKYKLEFKLAIESIEVLDHIALLICQAIEKKKDASAL